MDVEAYMAERIPQIDAAIEARFARAADRVPAPLAGAMRHLLFPGGKRLRPVFALAAAEAVGGQARAALPLAVAVELIHTYSLVHDDLPCMDDDDWRRGRPTVHVAFDEATAVLAGDALQSEAFATLADDPVAAADPARMLFVVGRLARAIGAEGLVGGQQDDLAFDAARSAGAGAGAGTGAGSNARSDAGGGTSGTDHARLASIHERKTAALFQAAIVGGAVLGGANDDERARLEGFARDVGVAFQIADDLLDADSAEAASILRLQGIDDARAGAEGLVERALLRIDGWGERAVALRELARFAVRRRR